MGTCGVFMHDMVSHNAVTICSERQNTVLIHLKCLANRRSITLLFFFVFSLRCCQVLQNRGLLYYEIGDIENALQDFLAASKVE